MTDTAENPGSATEPTSHKEEEVITYEPTGARGKVIARAVSTLAFSGAAIWALSINSVIEPVGVVLFGIAAVLLAVGFAKSAKQGIQNNTLHLRPKTSSYRFGPEGAWNNIKDLTWKSVTITTPRLLDSHSFVTRFTLLFEDKTRGVFLQDAHDTLGRKPWSQKHRDGLRWLLEDSSDWALADKQTLAGFVEAMDITAGVYQDKNEEKEDANG